MGSAEEERPTKNKGNLILWTTYFDSTKSRSKGRRVSRSIAIAYPRVQEVADAAKRLGLKYEVRVSAAHPISPTERVGLIAVKKSNKKTAILKSIAKEIKALRGVKKPKKKRRH